MRVGNSNVLVEIVVRAFQDGATPETIVQRYPTTTLANVYAVISYYLRHKEDIEKYLNEREKKGKELKSKIENGQNNLSNIREKLRKQRIMGD